MITREQVLRTFGKWRGAGLRPPVDDAAKAEQMISDFQRNYDFLTAEQLELLGDKLSHSPVWPTYFVLNQALHELEVEQQQPVEEDPLAILEEQAYGDQDLEGFVLETARSYFPQQDEEWCQRYALELHWYGLVAYACKTCKGSCPFAGHQLHLRLNDKGEPYRVGSWRRCERYKG